MNHIVLYAFCTFIKCIFMQFVHYASYHAVHIQPPHGKTNNLHRRKQRRRSASRFTAKLISTFVFATRIVKFPLYLTPKFQASSLLLLLYSLICVSPVRKPYCWFFHEVAHIFIVSHVASVTRIERLKINL